MEEEGIQKKVINGNFYTTRPVGRPRTRWADVVQRDALRLLGIRGWRRRTENRDGWRRVMREAKARKGLYRHTWNETLHVSDSSSVHHQEYITVHTAMVYVIQFCRQLANRIRMTSSQAVCETV
jgi:hypothetical protein